MKYEGDSVCALRDVSALPRRNVARWQLLHETAARPTGTAVFARVRFRWPPRRNPALLLKGRPLPTLVTRGPQFTLGKAIEENFGVMVKPMTS